MSCWTKIRGYVEVEPFGRTQEEMEFILKTVLNHLPLVSGSEGRMNTHIIQAAGYDSSSNYDEFGFNTIKVRKDDFELQSTYFILLEGRLRDTTYDSLYKHFIKWLTRLAKRVYVDNVDVVFEDFMSNHRIEYNDLTYIFDEYSWFSEVPSTNWVERIIPPYCDERYK